MILKADLRHVRVITVEERKKWIPKRHQTTRTWSTVRNGMKVVYPAHMYERLVQAHDPTHPVHPGISRVMDSAAEEMVDWIRNEMAIDEKHPRRFYRKMSDQYYINGTSNENQYGDIIFGVQHNPDKKPFREISGPDIILNIGSWEIHLNTVTQAFPHQIRPHGIHQQHIRTGNLQEYTGGAIKSAVEAQKIIDPKEIEDTEGAPEVKEPTDFQAKLKGLKTTMISKINALQFMGQPAKASLIQKIENITLEENTKESLLRAGIKIKDIVQSGAVAIPWGKPEDARYFTGEQGYVSATIDNWEKLLRSLFSNKPKLNWEDIVKLDDECCEEARRKVLREMENQTNHLLRIGGRREDPAFGVLIEGINFLRDCNCEDLKLVLTSFSDEAERIAIEAGGLILDHYHRMVAIRREWDLCEEHR